MADKPMGPKALLRKLVKWVLFLTGAAGPIQTAYKYLSGGSLKVVGLSTSLTLWSVTLNCGYLTGLYLWKMSLALVESVVVAALIIGIVTLPSLLLIWALLSLVFGIHRVLEIVNKKAASAWVPVTLAFVSMGKWITVRMKSKEWKEGAYGAVSVVCVCIAAIIGLVDVFNLRENPLSASLSLANTKARVITSVGLVVLGLAYSLVYIQVSRFLKELRKEEKES